MRLRTFGSIGIFYEVFDTEEEKRRRSVLGLGEFRQIHIPELLDQEMKTGTPVRSITAPVLTFNPKRQTTNWGLVSDESPTISRYKEKDVDPRVAFWRSSFKTKIPGFAFEDLNWARGDEEKFRALCERLRRIDTIKSVAEELGIEHSETLDESWLLFRHLQAWMMQALVLQHHYPHGLNRKARDLEHDVHDIEYLTLGLHVGGLASAETSAQKHSMGWRFKILAPEGFLLTPDRMTGV